PVMLNKKWGYIDVKGNWVVEPKYTNAEIFSEDGLAPVTEKKMYGFINTKGEEIVPQEYTVATTDGFFTQALEGYKNGFARVRVKKEWFFLDKQGKRLGEEGYLHIWSFN
ncbi:MAG TPA: WG repeat-containing protein, partial [Brumimicrobium sp.]|nr:WG repeat-containing protein [Brumimicrobium sp.]